MKRLHHPNILQFIGILYREGKLLVLITGKQVEKSPACPANSSSSNAIGLSTMLGGGVRVRVREQRKNKERDQRPLMTILDIPLQCLVIMKRPGMKL